MTSEVSLFRSHLHDGRLMKKKSLWCERRSTWWCWLILSFYTIVFTSREFKQFLELVYIFFNGCNNINELCENKVYVEWTWLGWPTYGLRKNSHFDSIEFQIFVIFRFSGRFSRRCSALLWVSSHSWNFQTFAWSPRSRDYIHSCRWVIKINIEKLFISPYFNTKLTESQAALCFV